MNRIAVKLSAPNDTNGNPQRVFVVLDGEANTLAAVDEGYDGYAALGRAGYPNTPVANVYIAVGANIYDSVLQTWGDESAFAIIRDAKALDRSFAASASRTRYERAEERVLAAALDVIVSHGHANDQAATLYGHVAQVGRFLLYTDEQGATYDEFDSSDAASLHVTKLVEQFDRGGDE